MKHKIFLLLTVIFFIQSSVRTAHAQPSNFTTTEDTIYISTTTSEFVLYNVFEFVNLSDSLVFVGWEKEEINIPSEWDAQVALPPNYFPYVDDSSGVISIGPSGSGDVDLFFVGIFPNGFPSSGVVKIHAFDHFNPIDTLTVVFYITITGPYLNSHVPNTRKGIVSTDYSNNSINISAIEAGRYNLKLFDAKGMLVHMKWAEAYGEAIEFQLPLNLVGGNYILQFIGPKGSEGVGYFYWP